MLKKNKSKISIFVLTLLVVFILVGSAIFLTKVLSSPSPNKILIYTNIDNITSKKEVDLVLFFAGYTLGSGSLVAPYEWGGLELSPYLNNKYRDNIIFASIDTNPVTHWGSPEAVNSVLKDIKKLLELYNIKRIFLIGGSMGSSLVLNIASLADDEIKTKISGVIAYLPITDYSYTLEHCNNSQVKEVIYKHFKEKDKDGRLIIDSSPFAHVNNLPEKTKIILIATTEDKTVPSEQVDLYYLKAKQLRKNVELHKVTGDHNTGYIKEMYKKVIKEILG